MKTQLIINPIAGHGTMLRRWGQIETLLQAEHFACDAVFTERHEHGIELARRAVEAGYDLVVAVGGDGTLNEVVNGMMADGKPLNPAAALGVITSGTGGDFARTAGISRDPLAAARQLARATTTRPIDLGEMILTREGKEARRYFANIAGMGFDAEVAERIETQGKYGGGTIPYLSTLISTISTYQNKDVDLAIDAQPVQGRMNSVIVCNGKFFGGGMMVSPNAVLDDALFHVILLGDLTTLDVLANTPKIYNGTHLTHPKISEYTARQVRVESKQRMLIQADGEFIGPGPATFRILPAALRLRA